MSPVLVGALVFGLLLLAIWVGHRVRRFLPDRKVSAETKDTVKLAVGLIGTMSALLLGLLVSSAKSSYDTQQTQVTQMAAKVSFLNRVLTLYGTEGAEARREFHIAVGDSIRRLWPAEKDVPVQLGPDLKTGDAVYFAIENLRPHTEVQQKLKAAAEANIIELAELRTLLDAQSHRSISALMLTVVILWLVVIFTGFSLLAPADWTANVALTISAVAVAGAIFLLLELDQPFAGLLQIPSQELVNALKETGA